MCGLVGYARSDCVKGRTHIRLEKAVAEIRHRGPDGSGIWHSSDEAVGLAHARLAIVDLSPSGAQPMTSGSGRSVISFNGEIYNYKRLRRSAVLKEVEFKSDTDTEVILEGFEREGIKTTLQHLEGMFAFAIYDQKAATITLARDRAGEKPLYYRLDDGFLTFGSELKAIHSENVRLDYEVLDSVLSFGYHLNANTLMCKYKKVPAGHYAVFCLKTGSFTIKPYWVRPPFKALSACNTEALERELENRLSEVVAEQLEADVPVGVLLSGGVDSTLITMMAAKSKTTVDTYTVAFSNYSTFDEAPHAQLVSDHYGTRHTVLEASDVSPEILLPIARQLDDPIIDSSIVPTYLLAREVRKKCKVVLGGDGADELFGGYTRYSRRLLLGRVTSCMPRIAREHIKASLNGILPAQSKILNWAPALVPEIWHGLPPVSQIMRRGLREDLVPSFKSLPRELRAEELWRSQIPRETGILALAMGMDFDKYLCEDILVKVDRASMLSSLEVRAPFLHHSIIEFAASIPDHLKATSSSRKNLLKRIISRNLPKNFDLKRKQGFSLPLDDLLRKGEWRLFFEDVLFASNTMFSEKAIKSLFHSLDRGEAMGEKLFALALLTLWIREYDIDTKVT